MGVKVLGVSCRVDRGQCIQFWLHFCDLMLSPADVQ